MSTADGRSVGRLRLYCRSRAESWVDRFSTILLRRQEQTASNRMGNSTPPEPKDPFILQSGATPPDPAARSSASDQDALQTFIAGSEMPPHEGRLQPFPPPSAATRCGGPLARGSFGTVYLGHDAQLDRPVAIKVLRSGPNVPQEEADRLLQEARKLARLHHPGIVTVHDVGTQDGQVFIVSNYLDGRTLPSG